MFRIVGNPGSPAGAGTTRCKPDAQAARPLLSGPGLVQRGANRGGWRPRGSGLTDRPRRRALEPRPADPSLTSAGRGPRCLHHLPRRRPLISVRLVPRLVPHRLAARRSIAVHGQVPRPAHGTVGGYRWRAVTRHPRHGDQARSPLVPVLALLRVMPPGWPPHPHKTIRTRKRTHTGRRAGGDLWVGLSALTGEQGTVMQWKQRGYQRRVGK
jgi:hypothetical protein